MFGDELVTTRGANDTQPRSMSNMIINNNSSTTIYEPHTRNILGPSSCFPNVFLCGVVDPYQLPQTYASSTTWYIGAAMIIDEHKISDAAA